MTRKIDPRRFDQLVAPAAPTSRVVWTAAAIGARIGRGEDFVRDVLSRLPSSPVRRMGRRWYAYEDDLLTFMRNYTS